jgi:hypothetical protein
VRKLVILSAAIAGATAVTASAATGVLGSSDHVVNFGHQAVGVRSVQTITITNDSAASLPLRLFVPSAGYGAPGGTCGAASEGPAVLAPGESCTIDVQFWPQEAGKFFGTLDVYGLGPDPLLEVKLHGFAA